MRLGLAGFCATAVSFGPARNGYGLFLPEIREDFGLSTGMLGVIASGLYAGYLAALVAVGLLAARTGPRLPVGIGLLSAAGGSTLVALAPNATVLAAGVVLAGTSAGWSWAPYNDAVERTVPGSSRDRVLSVVSTGTTFGITAGAPVTFKVRTFRTTHGSETWDFGDGTPPARTRSDGNVKALAKDGYAQVVHSFARPGTYLVRVTRANEYDYRATAHLAVEVRE